MEILRSVPKIDFIGKRKIFLTISAVLLAVCAVSLLTRGLRYGVDFAGGTVIQFRFQKTVGPEAIRSALRGLVPGNPSVQAFGTNEYLVQVEQSPEHLEGLAKRARDGLATTLGDPGLEVRRVEMVGPKVGKDLRKKGLIATVLALAGILLYVWLRFEFYYGLGGVIALFHD
ncbi:MAG: protein translocase subunit SecF, partial [Deltaproteobacteria bacterium]|nr:protein translocase subunit SecF [Deltaproteobacteria bacterium]